MLLLISVLLGAAPADPAAPAPSPRMDHARILAAVRAEWARYDKGGKGRLTPLEFSTWVMQAHGGQVAERASDKGIAPVSAMNASAAAFARADANHDGGVTPEEMTGFLMRLPSASAAAKPALPGKPLTALIGGVGP